MECSQLSRKVRSLSLMRKTVFRGSAQMDFK
jgi:hypothetical protein